MIVGISNIIISALIAIGVFNIGHRLGGNMINEYPENTIECLQLFLGRYSDDPHFSYLELDVQETKDSNLVIFHDNTIERIIPLDKFGNDTLLAKYINTKKESYNMIDFSKNELMNFKLDERNTHISNLEQILSFLDSINFNKEILVEIKLLKTDKSKQHLIDIIDKYNNNLKIKLMADVYHYQYSFTNPEVWCSEFKDRNVDLVTVGFHNGRCDKKLTSNFLSQKPLDRNLIILSSAILLSGSVLLNENEW
ncbi:MAG: hypothetical protein GWP19_00465 [Planctomycetia bacterium]|nr:hypothetical protein [Planctomycetia bacterium]